MEVEFVASDCFRLFRLGGVGEEIVDGFLDRNAVSVLTIFVLVECQPSGSSLHDCGQFSRCSLGFLQRVIRLTENKLAGSIGITDVEFRFRVENRTATTPGWDSLITPTFARFFAADVDTCHRANVSHGRVKASIASFLSYL